MTIFFKSANHRDRFLEIMQQLGKIYAGKLDLEYAAALYILSADLSTWNKSQGGYISNHGIDFPALLAEEDFSGSYAVIIQLAGNLFNGQIHVDPVEFMRLDDSNFRVALTAIQLRRASLSVDDFKL